MANILLDPGFESGSWFTFWPGYTTSGAHTDSQDNTVSFNNSGNSFKIVATAGVIDAGRNQTANENTKLSLLARGTYLFSGWIKTGANVTNAHCVIRDTSVFAAVAGAHVTTASQDWTYFQGSFTADGTLSYDVLVGLGSYGSTSDGTAWFDDIHLEMIHSGYDRPPNSLKSIVVGDGISTSGGIS